MPVEIMINLQKVMNKKLKLFLDKIAVFIKNMKNLQKVKKY